MPAAPLSPCPSPRSPGRRTAMLSLASSMLLAACGGGGGDTAAPPPVQGPGNQPPLGGTPPAAPSITRLELSSPTVFVGETLRVRAEFSGGQGLLQPQGLPVQSGSETLVGPFDRHGVVRLVVSTPGQRDAERALPVRVDFRNRYQGVDLRLAVSQHAAVATGDGQVLVIGGSRGGNTLSTQIDRYDPRGHTLTAIGQLSQGRAGARATRLASGQVLVTGGEFSGTDWRLAELVDERSGAVTPAGRLSVTRSGHAAIALPGGQVLVTGGTTTGEGASLGLSRSAELWDPATRSFRRLPQGMLEARAGHSMSLLPDGRVLIVGGYVLGLQPLFAELFDPATESFRSLAVWLTPRAEHAALVLPDGSVLVAGGEQPAAPGSADWAPTASVLRYLPAEGRFVEQPALAGARAGMAAVATPDGEVLLFGGLDAQGRKTGSAERYDPATGGRAIAALAGPRTQHSATRLPSSRIVVIGGEAEGLDFASQMQVYE